MDVSCSLVRFRFISGTPLLTSRSTSCGKCLIDSSTALGPFGGSFLLGAPKGHESFMNPLGLLPTAVLLLDSMADFHLIA